MIQKSDSFFIFKNTEKRFFQINLFSTEKK